MTICFLTKTLDIKSGYGRCSFEIVSRLAQEKDIQVVVLTEESSDLPFERAILRKVSKNPFSLLLNILKVRPYLKQADILHALDGYPYGIIAWLANFGLKKKLIVSVLGSYSVAPLNSKLKGFLLRGAYQKAEKILCISSFTQKQILKKINLPNSQVIHLGVDFDKFQRETPVEKSKEKIILSIGALKRRKGYHISIPAVGLVKKKHPHLKYYIVGDQGIKGYFQELERLVKENNLENNVVFLEKISDEQLIQLYHQTDLFLLTPVNIGDHFEGFGLVYLEANACAKPVIGTYNCGAEDIVRDGFNGCLVPQNDIQATAQTILKILDNPSLAQELGQNGRKLAQEMSWERTIENYLAIYQ